jgi:hypothetical protein
LIPSFFQFMVAFSHPCFIFNAKGLPILKQIDFYKVILYLTIISADGSGRITGN